MPIKPEMIKTRSGRVVELPTAEVDARINAGIAADLDGSAMTQGRKPGRAVDQHHALGAL